MFKGEDPPNEWDLNGDGKLSKYEADQWGFKGNGSSITIDGNKIDLKGFNLKHMKESSTNGIYGYDTVDVFRDLPYETASIFGDSSFKFNNGQWQMISQRYHYNMRPFNTFKNIARNIMTVIGHPASSSSHGYPQREFKDYMINIKY